MGPGDRPGQRGKIADLAAFCAANGAQIEADLARYYRIDLRDLWRKGGGASRLTFRRLRVLLDNLPADSATNTAVRDRFTDAELAEMSERRGDSSYGPWGRLDYWLAGLSDRIDHLAWVMVRVNGGKGDAPAPLPRPGLVVESEFAPPDPGLVALLEARRQDRRAQQAPACGCPPEVLDVGRHLTSCTFPYPQPLPEEGDAP